MYGGVWLRFSRRGVDVAENSSELGFLYEDPGRHAQRHTNHKPVFAEIADIVKIVFAKIFSVLRPSGWVGSTKKIYNFNLTNRLVLVVVV